MKLLFLFFIFIAAFVCAHAAAAADVMDNEELVSAMEIFMAMSEQERYETIQGLLEAVGHDPAKRKEMEQFIAMLPPILSDDESQNSQKHNIRQLIQQDELLKAKHDAAQHIPQDWDSFWSMQAEILEATLASGQLTPEQAATFKTDETAWEEQLRMIYNDLRGGGDDEL
uniref:Uncharacterized protein n=1 Tax=Amphora coffeiformis TaxID=265554 RepID=A0A7S3P6Z9_9STRA|eukprot:scaffold8126_cov170-Amphora_coffeaeformis.AAC.4